MLSTGSLNHGLALALGLGLVILAASSLGCDKKELREEKYPNGGIKVRGYVKKDAEKNYVKTGEWTEWYENAQKSAEGQFADGKKVGLWTFWHNNGQKSAETQFAGWAEKASRTVSPVRRCTTVAWPELSCQGCRKAHANVA
jgi:hypothetical protein